MRDQIVGLFYMTFQKEFEFLVNGYGFHGPFFKEEPLLYKAWYQAKNIAIEHSLDWKDQAVDFYIFRLKNETIPYGWLFDDQGERIRIPYLNWLLDNGIKDLQFPKLRGLSFSDQIPVEIHHNAYLLQKHGYIFLEDKLDAFLSSS